MAGSFNPKELIVNFANDNQGVPALQFIRDDPDGIHFKLNEGNGVINYVYRVQSADNKSSVILKYAEETARLMPGVKLPLARQELEYHCLSLMHTIQPGSAPAPFCLDKNHHVLAMTDMSDWELLGTQLERRHIDVTAATNLGHLLGKLHYETSKDNVSIERWEELQRDCHGVDMKGHYQFMTCIRPFTADDPMNKIAEVNREAYDKYVTDIDSLGLQKKMCDLFNAQMCFIHADCHYKSIFVKDGHVALFDFEAAYLGHPACNVAFPLASYVGTYLFDQAHTKGEQAATGLSREECRAACLPAIRNLIDGYLEAQKDISKSEEAQMEFLQALALFSGGMLFMIGTFAHIELLMEGITAEDRQRVLKAGFSILKGHDQVNTVDDCMQLMHIEF